MVVPLLCDNVYAGHVSVLHLHASAEGDEAPEVAVRTQQPNAADPPSGFHSCASD